MNPKLQKFIHGNGANERIFHSNAYARVAHGSSIGSTDPQSFEQRMHVHKNRQSVRHYGDSMIGRTEVRQGAKSIGSGEESRDHPVKRPFVQRPRPGRKVAAPPSRTGFREPPTRGYNPYS